MSVRRQMSSAALAEIVKRMREELVSDMCVPAVAADGNSSCAAVCSLCCVMGVLCIFLDCAHRVPLQDVPSQGVPARLCRLRGSKMVFGSKVRVDAVGSGHPGSAAGGEVLSPRGASRVRLAVTCGCFGPSVMPRRASGRSSVRVIDVVDKDQLL